MRRSFAVLNLLGLLSGVLGGLCWYYSLVIEPSPFTLVKVADKQFAMCLDGKVIQAGYGGPLIATEEACPNVQGTGPTLQVVTERPKMANWAIPLIVLGFILQVPAALLAVLASKQ
jgi:hypothetical protein